MADAGNMEVPEYLLPQLLLMQESLKICPK